MKSLSISVPGLSADLQNEVDQFNKTCPQLAAPTEFDNETVVYTDLTAFRLGRRAADLLFAQRTLKAAKARPLLLEKLQAELAVAKKAADVAVGAAREEARELLTRAGEGVSSMPSYDRNQNDAAKQFADIVAMHPIVTQAKDDANRASSSLENVRRLQGENSRLITEAADALKATVAKLMR